jgi:steroid 5-alpha reductase family enzyme
MSKVVALVSTIVVLICVAITQSLAYYGNKSRNFIINYLAAYIMAVQWVVFIHAGGFFGNQRTEKYYDLTGSLTYLSTVALSLILSTKITVRQIILSSFVGIWSARLGWFLFTRIHNTGGVDSRFEEIKKDNFRFWMTWTLQGTWVFICLLPVLQVSQHPEDRKLATLDYVGIGLWTFGFLFEVVADYQKSQFRANPDNKNTFINSGLWSISRFVVLKKVFYKFYHV